MVEATEFPHLAIGVLLVNTFVLMLTRGCAAVLRLIHLGVVLSADGADTLVTDGAVGVEVEDAYLHAVAEDG